MAENKNTLEHHVDNRPLHLKYWPLKMLSKTMWLINWPYGTCYGKTEFRFGFFEVENPYKVVK